MRVLAVIPARGGSKGIPRKNVRLMNGRPLITYAIETAKACSLISDIVVTSDDEESISIAKLGQVNYINRSMELAGDNVTLDPVIYDAVIKMEAQNKIIYDIVITLQPTSPLLTSNTLQTALESFIQNNQETYISVVNKPHLSWSMKDGKYIPNYLKRLNRQQLPPNYFETGAFFITRREFVKQDSRMGNEISVFEIPECESVDIDSTSDWIVCESELKKKRIVFRADGYKELGMGHIYHCLTLAYNLTGHDIMFVTDKNHIQGYEKIKSSHMPMFAIEKEEEFFGFLKEWKADIIVNDRLDTEKEYILKLKSLANKVITIEDLGEGAKYADAVINALYNEAPSKKNQFMGEKYICLRDEFMIHAPKEFSKKVQKVLVMFGGTDPSNLTRKIYDLALRVSEIYQDIQFTFIGGAGYDCKKHEVLSREDKNIIVLNDVKRVSDHMREADLAFTSQGRTVFELAAMGVPSIVLAQNEREQLHTFAQMQNGFLNLGLGKDITLETIESTFKWLVETEQIRYEMQSLMLKHDLKKGINNIIEIILEEF